MRTLRVQAAAPPAPPAPIETKKDDDMIIVVDERTRINATDGLNFVVQRRMEVGDSNPITGEATKNAGRIRWDTLGYHGSLLQAALATLQKRICNGDREVTLRELIVELRESSKRIADACRVAPESLKSRVLPEDVDALEALITKAAESPTGRI